MTVTPTVAVAPPKPAPPSPAPAPGKPAPAPSTAASQLARSAPPSAVGAKQEAELPADAPGTVVELVEGEFSPPADVADYLVAKKRKPAAIRVRLGDVAAGTIKVKRSGSHYETPSTQPVPLLVPWLAPLRSIGVDPVLAVKVRGGKLSGFASVVTKGVHVGGEINAFLDAIEKNAAALGWLGLERPNLRGVKNKLEGSVLVVGADKVSFRLAKFLEATGSFRLENGSFAFDATATGKIARLGTITVPIKGAPDGSISGSAQIDIAVKGFTGHANVVFARGLVDVRGEVGYSNEKFDGKVTIIATDAESAKAIVAGQIPGQQAAPTAGPTAGAVAAPPATDGAVAAPAEGPKPGPRVVAGWGKVNVRLAEWLSGDALVVVSPTWDVTVVGQITPRMNKPLFPQKDFTMVLFAPPELRASYGLPVVGNVYLFANIVLTAEAKLGPATLKDMSMSGTYSTDPTILQGMTLTGTLNISGFAGLRLKASGGAGIEILDHDIKAGISVWALAGIKGYVEATPRIGYREIADPQAGKKGEFFIGGHMELAARPFLELGGELFVELDSPWWSPAPDKRWPWDLGSIEYPLPGEFGIGADVEHVLGSGTMPQVKFGNVDFNAEKFLTDLVSDDVPPKTSVPGEKKGAWREPPAPTPEPVAPPAPPPKVKGQPAGARLPGAKAKPAKPKPRTPAQQKLWTQGLAAIAELATRSQTDPFTAAEIEGALKSIRRKFKFSELKAIEDGAYWLIDAAMSPGEPAGKVKRDPKPEPPASPAAPEAEAPPAKPPKTQPDPGDIADLKKLRPRTRIKAVTSAGRVGDDLLSVRKVHEQDWWIDYETVGKRYGTKKLRPLKLRLRAFDASYNRLWQVQGRETAYAFIEDSKVPSDIGKAVGARAKGMDEYRDVPVDKGSLDHTVAKKEFATEYDGVEELWEENLLDIVHDIDNVRLQELRLNTLRKNVPWTNPAFPGHEEYDQPSINRALAFYGAAQAKLASRVKSALAVQSTV